MPGNTIQTYDGSGIDPYFGMGAPPVDPNNPYAQNPAMNYGNPYTASAGRPYDLYSSGLPGTGPSSYGDGSIPMAPWMGQSDPNAPWANAENTPYGTMIGAIPINNGQVFTNWPGSVGAGGGGGGGNGTGVGPGTGLAGALGGMSYPLSASGLSAIGAQQGMFGASDDGRRDFVHDDYVNAALSRLNDVQSGRTLPFDETTRNNLLSKASDMNAAAEGQQAQSFRDQAAMGGASLTDPSTQAAMRELDSRRQGANSTAAQTIDTQANLQNFAAQQTANSQMAALRMQQRSQSTLGQQPAPGGTATYNGSSSSSGTSTSNPSQGSQANPGNPYANGPFTGYSAGGTPNQPTTYNGQPYYSAQDRYRSQINAINSGGVNPAQGMTWNGQNNSWSNNAPASGGPSGGTTSPFATGSAAQSAPAAQPNNTGYSSSGRNGIPAGTYVGGVFVPAPATNGGAVAPERATQPAQAPAKGYQPPRSPTGGIIWNQR